MKYASVAVAFKEERFIQKHLRHIPDWVDEKMTLSSAKPWFGDNMQDDTPKLAEKYSTVIRANWPNEESQRNTGQEMNEDKDWIIVLDPDEFLDNDGWAKLKEFLETTDADAVICEGQYTMWKNGYVADPPNDYQMLIAVRPHVRFVDKRVINTAYVVAPVWVYHFSWARTDDEVWNKISHYAHAKDFDIKKWYNEVWKTWKEGDKDCHPTTPETLHEFKRVVLPKEIEALQLWP
jgi:glycosyltransferase involved in cell wall biosynthesis